MSQISFVNGKYQTLIDGKLVKRTNLKHLEYTLRKAGIASDAPMVPAAAVKSEFTPTERFGFISKFIKLLGNSVINSFILTGSGGIGKTTAVLRSLTDMGFVEDTPDKPSGDFMVIRGFSTPRALYETLFEYRNKILILDDADQVFKDPLGANLLKAALDDKKVRIINWNSSRENEDIPPRFTYTGRIIFISNLSIENFPQAIVSRSQKVDMTLTNEEKVEVISRVFDDMDNDPVVKADVLEFVKTYANQAKDLNVRSATSLLTLRENFGEDWERIAKYSFCG
jgi:hypothetical protein